MTKKSDAADATVAVNEPVDDKALVMTYNVIRPRGYTDDVVGAIDSFEAAFDLATQVGGEVEEFGSGVEVVDDKRLLLGVEFLALEWSFNKGDYGMFVSVLCVRRDGSKFVINSGDSASGIYPQLVGVTARRIRRAEELDESGQRGLAEAAFENAQRHLYVKRGLRVSEYATDLETGKPVDKSFTGPTGKGATFYLA
jgi:hypothetical protein